MLTNRDDVLGLLRKVRKDFGDFFIPIGGFDDSTQSKREISNLTGTLYNYLPLVKSMVEAARDKPIYVGYDGRSPDSRSATYTNNLILLHEDADESSLEFITAYTHELTHMDQARRGLLRENARPPSTPHMVDYIAHNLMLEAAAFATEAVSIYYIGEHSKLRDEYEEVQEYFDAFAEKVPGRGLVRLTIEDAMQGRRVKNFLSLKPAWQAAFQSFFDPDSAHVSHYLKQFAQVYMQKRASKDDMDDVPEDQWGGEDQLRAITTMPGMGPMFTRGAMPIMRRAILASILQDKHLEVIDVIRDMAKTHDDQSQKIMNFILSMKPSP